MAKFLKKDLGTLPHLSWDSLQQLVTVEIGKRLHLVCDKILGSPSDFYVSDHHIRSILTLNINIKNKQINECQIRCLF